MQKVKLNKQVSVFIALALVLLVELGVLLPLSLGRITGLGREIKNLKEKMESVESDWARRESYQKQKVALKEELNVLRKRIIEPGKKSEAISFISKSSRAQNIDIKSITPLEAFAVDQKSLYHLPFRIEAEGGFHDLTGFLGLLQEEGYFFKTKELAVTGYNPNKIRLVLCGLGEKK